MGALKGAHLQKVASSAVSNGSSREVGTISSDTVADSVPNPLSSLVRYTFREFNSRHSAGLGNEDLAWPRRRLRERMFQNVLWDASGLAAASLSLHTHDSVLLYSVQQLSPVC